MTTEKKCGTCRYWSDLLAKTNNGVVVALCLSSKGSRKNEWVDSTDSCEAYSKGDPVDLPTDTGS